MTRGIKIGLTVGGIVAVLPIVAIVVLFVGMPQIEPSQTVRREIRVANHGSLIIDGKKRSRSEHGFSQRAGYRPPGSPEIEWFGDVSDGVEPQVYQAGPLVVVIDLPAAQLYVRIHAVYAETGRSRIAVTGALIFIASSGRQWRRTGRIWLWFSPMILARSRFPFTLKGAV